MYKSYAFHLIETEVQDAWNNEKAFCLDTSFDISSDRRLNYYCLPMFPYPSGSHLHMGHMRNYTVSDCIARYKKLQGYRVLHTMGFDAFGLPAENAAIENKVQPSKWTYDNISNMRSSLKSMGFGYDWSKELITCDPKYYVHQQRLFIQLFNKGLAYQKLSWVNYDPVDKTVLANEQVISGRGWRSNALVERRLIKQWFIKASSYAKELYDDLDKVKDWPANLISMQRKWIGRSRGRNFTYRLKEKVHGIDAVEVFTTLPESIVDVQAVLLALNHPISRSLASNSEEVKLFMAKAVILADRKALSTMSFKTHLEVYHPFSQKVLCVWISNLVKDERNTEAMHVAPNFSERDSAWMKENNLDVDVIEEEANLKKAELISKPAEYYRLRDWGVSRQRSWGCPIPMVYCSSCGVVVEDESRLPILTQSKLETTCPNCGKPAEREKDTFDTFVESSWYYARYICSDGDSMLDKRVHNFLPVDCYIGGIEHATLHFLYARLFYRLMRDLNYLDMSKVDGKEPFEKVITQGMVLLHGTKMSKSKGNIISPSEITALYGVDTARMFTLVSAPVTKDFEFNRSGVIGIYRFLERLYQFGTSISGNLSDVPRLQEYVENHSGNDETYTILNLFNAAILDMSQDKLNTAASYTIKLMNEICKVDNKFFAKSAYKDLLVLLHPIAPHITSYIWRHLVGGDILSISYPVEIASKTKRVTVLQVNGRVFKSVVNLASKDDALPYLLRSSCYCKMIKPKVVKVIYIKDKVCNFVLKESADE